MKNAIKAIRTVLWSPLEFLPRWGVSPGVVLGLAKIIWRFDAPLRRLMLRGVS